MERVTAGVHCEAVFGQRSGGEEEELHFVLVLFMNMWHLDRYTIHICCMNWLGFTNARWQAGKACASLHLTCDMVLFPQPVIRLVPFKIAQDCTSKLGLPSGML